MRNSLRNLLVSGLLSGLSAWAGLITSAASQAFAPGGAVHLCNTGTLNQSSAFCSTSAEDSARGTAQATASYGSVSAYIQGGSNKYGGGASATAIASFSDTLTFFGGAGTGVVTIWESAVNFGAGSLGFGAYDPHPQSTSITQTFTFGSPFTISLSALASSSFIGAYCDAGSLLAQKSIVSVSAFSPEVPSISYTDLSGHAYNTLGTAGFTAAPEPGTWVLGLIGLGLLGVAKVRLPGPNGAADANQDEQ